MYRIYMAELKETGEVYIGRTSLTTGRRISCHIYDANNKHDGTGLHRLIKENGVTNMKEFKEIFNVVILKDHIETEEKAKFYEDSFISFYDNVIEEAIVVNKRKPKDENFWIAAMLEDK